MFLEISQNSQESTGARVSFLIKLQASVNNKDTRTTSSTSLWCPYCEFWRHFTPFSTVLLALNRWKITGHFFHVFSFFQREFFNNLIKELESKDRNQLLEEISNLRRGMDSLNKNIDNLTHDLNAKESINDKNQDTILKLYQAIDQEKGDKLNLQ